jgi:hypothetical protein
VNQKNRIDEILSLTGFIFTRLELDRISTRSLALAYFYPFFCPIYRQAISEVRELLWRQSTAPFPFDPNDPGRDWWQPLSPFLSHIIPGQSVRWILGEDLPGGASETAPHYRDFMSPWTELPEWYQNLRPGIRQSLDEAFQQTYKAVPYTGDAYRGGLLFNHDWMLEFARSNVPCLKYQDIEITSAFILGSHGSKSDPRAEIRLFSSSLVGADVAAEYIRIVGEWDQNQNMKLFDGWPGGTPQKCGPVKLNSVEVDSEWILPSISFKVFPPWPSGEMIGAFVNEALSEFGHFLPVRPTAAEVVNWVKALATTSLVEWSRLSGRQAISLWNEWAKQVSMPPGLGIPAWSPVHESTSPSEAQFSRERQKVLETMKQYHSQGLCQAES